MAPSRARILSCAADDSDGPWPPGSAATVADIVVTAAELRARQVLRDAGLGPVGDMTRAASRVNEVWLAGPYVVRVCTEPETERLSNEAAVAAALGDRFPYPPVVGHGRLQYAEWMVTERVPGLLLSKAWPAMDDAERTEAMRQLASALHQLHTTAPPHEPAFTAPGSTASPHQLPPDRLLGLIERSQRLPGADAGLLREAAATVERLAPAVLPWPESTLVHGDLHLDNIIWDGLRITAVLDLEWSRSGPPDLDLDILLRYCSDPGPNVAGGAGAASGAFADVPLRLAEVYPELFSAPQLADRLLLYALAYDVPDLVRTSGRPTAPAGAITDAHPQRRVRRLLDGRTPWIEAAVAAAGSVARPRGGRKRQR